MGTTGVYATMSKIRLHSTMDDSRILYSAGYAPKFQQLLADLPMESSMTIPDFHNTKAFGSVF